MKIFITASFKNGANKDEIEKLCSYVRQAGFEDFCFIRDIENYKKTFDDPKELMRRAKKEIAQCDALFIDLTDKPTGRAIEAGMAYALGKKIFVIMKRGTAVKDSVLGIADYVVEYDHLEEIATQLSKIAPR